jgi:NADH dehydrogenase [ubiquinone] 1 alpha subcomplex assembly factor 7
MADALRALRVTPEFRRALRLHLVEISPILRRAQAEKLPDAHPVWHDDLATLPDGAMILLANEFLDALPIKQKVRTEEGWNERRVSLARDGASLMFTVDASLSAGQTLAGFGAAPLGSIREVCPAATRLAQALGARLRRAGGVALFIDYGYFPSACGDTLQALRHHRRHDVLADPGEADLTAHVDFAAFAAAAVQAGARAFGPVTQGDFLRSLGARERTAELLKRATPAQAAAIESGSRRLLDEKEMGTLFKVLALATSALGAPAGFMEETRLC